MTEPFTRLEPAPEVKIDKGKYVKKLKLLALRVPKVRHPTERASFFTTSCRRRRRGALCLALVTEALDPRHSAG
jgi:hypothetical protein